MKRYIKIIASIFLVLSLISVFLAGLWIKKTGIFRLSREKINTIVNHNVIDNTIVYDKSGKKIGEFFDKYSMFVPYKDIPTDVINAIIAIEDRNFFRHKGIDIYAILRAINVSLRNMSISQGASTITQQVVKNLVLTNKKMFDRKIKEILLSIQLEKIMSKQEIIELYLNNMFLGNGAYGVNAAAHRYFGKTLDQLELHETALIAGLFQSPSRYNPHNNPKLAKSRQKQVLHAMYEAGMLSKQRALNLAKQDLVYKKYKPINTGLAPHFLDYIKEEAETILSQKIEGRGLRIYTTLDADLQELANKSVVMIDSMIKENDPSTDTSDIEAALLTTNPKTGEILAMVGGKDYKKSQFNRVSSSKRAPGSAFKVVTYSLALQKGLKWSNLLLVSPISVNGYKPRNSYKNFLNEATLMKAFYDSMNTPTVELGTKLELENVIAQAKLLGVNSELRQEYGTILGSSEVTFFDMARMYGVFANKGKQNEIKAINKITDSNDRIIYESVSDEAKQVISEEIAGLMTEGLRNVLKRGTGRRSSQLSSVAVGKTGTTNGATDNWFCGYSNDLLGVVWVGSDSNISLPRRSSGSTLALPIWDNFMRASFKVIPPTDLMPVGDIVSYKVDPRYGNMDEGGIEMYFLRGQQPSNKKSAFEAIDNYTGRYRSVFSN